MHGGYLQLISLAEASILPPGRVRRRNHSPPPKIGKGSDWPDVRGDNHENPSTQPEMTKAISSSEGALKAARWIRYIIHVDGMWMATMKAPNVQELRPKVPDSEKITINLGYVDLGHIDLLVQDGFYSNRTDFIRTAIRNQLDRHADVVRKSVARKTLDLGLRHYSREDLEAVRAAGERLQINVLGLATIALDVTPELARAAIASVTVLGALHASPEVKAVLNDLMR
jgi:Arc/MetJ-type ribon-helix-helix transcriptional regulator